MVLQFISVQTTFGLPTNNQRAVKHMGRRSTHTPDQLRELILEATTAIVEQVGLEGLSAREIAKRVGYSPGTLYNVFENLDDLLLVIEARLLDELGERLANMDRSGPSTARLRRLVGTYFDFTQERPKLWNLLNEHRMPVGRAVPDWYQVKVESLLAPFEEVLSPLLTGTDAAAQKRHARTLWASVHGMTSLSTADKLSSITARSGQSLVDDLVSTYVAGLQKS
jgi:AcrR family transcriptional regulator